jgi:hypothetical protein
MTEKPTAGMVLRQEMGGSEIAVTGETVATVLAAKAKAEIEARFIMAERHPRNWMDVRRKLLDACERPGFAGAAREKGAGWYKKPIGEGVEGFSIRFAEEAMRNMGNMDARATIIWEDDEKRLVEINVVDFENNISIPTTVTINKTVERRRLKKGESSLGMRTNSRGEPVYLRAATDDEVLQKQNSAISKAMRTAILRLLPGDIQDECEKRIKKIRLGDKAKDPKAYQRTVVDGFARYGVSVAELEKYLKHPFASCSQAEFERLHEIWTAIKSGELTWHQVVSEKAQEDGKDAPPPPEADPLDAVAATLEAQQGAPQEAEDEFNIHAEVMDMAKDLYGKDAQKRLKAICKDLGLSWASIDEAGLGKVLDILIAEKERANG